MNRLALLSAALAPAPTPVFEFRDTFGSGKFRFEVLVDIDGWRITAHDGRVVATGLSDISMLDSAMAEMDYYIREKLVPRLEVAAAASAVRLGAIDAKFFDQRWSERAPSADVEPKIEVIEVNDAS
jgi:hypothetical protein